MSENIDITIKNIDSYDVRYLIIYYELINEVLISGDDLASFLGITSDNLYGALSSDNEWFHVSDNVNKRLILCAKKLHQVTDFIETKINEFNLLRKPEDYDDD